MMREAEILLEDDYIFIYNKCPSDNYLFHENLVSKYVFQK